MQGGRLTIGIDIATAAVRCVVWDVDHPEACVAEGSSLLPQPTSLAAQDVSQEPRYRQSAREALVAAVSSLSKDQRARVGAICVSATSGTVLALNSSGEPAGPALMYNDNRGAYFLRGALADDVGARPSATLGRMAWLTQNYPGIRVVTSADLVNEWLLGSPITESDTSHWLKAGIDPVQGTWPEKTLDAVGVDSSALPRLVVPGTELGLMSRERAEELGLRSVSVVAGMTDGCTSHIATGAMERGDSVGVLGTTLVIKTVAANSVDVPALGVYSHVSPDGTFLPGGASNTGAGVLTALFGPSDSVGLEARGQAALRHGPASYVDYALPGVGERFPVASSSIASFAIGEPSGVDDRYRAVLEGVAFSERLGLETLADHGVELNRHVISGGASASPSWSAIRATVLGRPVYRSRHGDSAVGAAFLAAHFLVGGRLADFLASVAPATEQVDPLPGEGEHTDVTYRRFVSTLVSRGFLESAPTSLSP